jgi:hypothetical protein
MSSYEYNQLLKFLYFEGYADSYAEAEELLESMSDEKFEDLFESSGMSPENRRTWNRLVRQYGERPFTNPKQSITRSARKPDPIPTTPKPKPRKKIEFIDKSGASDQGNTRDSRRRFGEEKENFDDVVEYLFVEGFADTIESAEVMAENISEQWVDEIIEKFNPKDYKEYHQKNHIDDRDQSDEWDAQEKDWQDSRGDIRDKHNMARNVRKKRGVK